MSRSCRARSERRARSVGPCVGGDSQVRALVSGRGFAASPVGAPGLAFRTSARGARRLIHEADADPAVRIGQHLRRHVALGQLIAGRQDDGRVADRNRAIEHEAVAVAPIALRVLVGLGDPQARLAAVGRHRRAPAARRSRCSLTVYFSGAAAHQIDHAIVAAAAVVRPAPMPIVKDGRAGGGERHFVDGRNDAVSGACRS